MGLLKDGLPLTWEHIVPHLDRIREQGISQLINLYHRTKDIDGSELRWGDEVEYVIVKFDHSKKKVRVALKVHDLLDMLQAGQKVNGHNPVHWAPEFAAYMIEGIPRIPYQNPLECPGEMEENLRIRREQISALLDGDETLISINFPSVASADFSHPAVSQDEALFPEGAVYPGHPRFKTVYRNTDARRTATYGVNVPIFRDVRTPKPFIDNSVNTYANLLALPDHVCFDHTGLACLQLTLQTTNMEEARYFYDQLVALSPIMLALSASTPIYRSCLSEVDCRWDVLCATSDDRTPEERGIAPSANGQRPIRSSRFSNVQCYVHPSSAAYNDLPLEYDDSVLERLVAAGIDEHLSKHVAHMFIRDPLQIFEGRIEQDDARDTEHFETIQSSIWMNVRFKPPPSDTDIGWRVEFRPMELQLTDVENAAYCCFVVLLTRVILKYKLSFVIPISLADVNMTRAQRRDAVRKERFYFRKDVLSSDEDGNVKEVAEVSLDEVFNGTSDGFPGLVPLIRRYLDEECLDEDAREKLDRYLQLIERRASGELWTLSRWMREFVDRHPRYQHDSHVKDEIVYDMFVKLNDIAVGKEHCEELLGNICRNGKDVGKGKSTTLRQKDKRLNGLKDDHRLVNGMKVR